MPWFIFVSRTPPFRLRTWRTPLGAQNCWRKLRCATFWERRHWQKCCLTARRSRIQFRYTVFMVFVRSLHEKSLSTSFYCSNYEIIIPRKLNVWTSVQLGIFFLSRFTDETDFAVLYCKAWGEIQKIRIVNKDSQIYFKFLKKIKQF